MAKRSKKATRWQDLDPYYERESKKYDRPAPSREFLMQFLEERGKPRTWEQVCEELYVDDEDEQEAVRRRLSAMSRAGQLMRNRRDGYGAAQKMDLIPGRVTAHPDGFGFLIPDAGGDDLFLSARVMRALMHGDRALARVVGVDRRGRKEGAVVEVLERHNASVVGRFFLDKGIGSVEPDNRRLTHDVLIPPEMRGEAQPGQIVVARIVEHPTSRSAPIGEIIEVMGEHMAPGMEIDVAIRAHGLPNVWSEGVEDEIAGLGEKVPEKAKKGRVDLRDLPLVTIDGMDARDFDDAVYCEPRPKGWKLLVAIADVSAYVVPFTALDDEAQIRATSVYFPERVIPMLPEVLSNGLCSLNPNVDRLCMVCEMNVDHQGNLTRSRFFEGLMRSHARLTYDQVGAALDGDKKTRRRLGDLMPHLEALQDLYGALRGARERRGAIDFETTETRIEFAVDRKIERIVPVVRNDAHKLIEECMILANVASARFLGRKKMPALYRVHDGPRAEKLEDLHHFLGEMGLGLPGGDKPEPSHYAALLAQIGDRPDAHLIQTVLLRSMSQAVYQPENTGHFGLALEAYAHFTSPIRRYPDLMVHRAIRHLLRGGKAKDFGYSTENVAALGEQCSMAERRADDATRDAISWLKCEYMLDEVGEEFPGIITGVTSFGLFVELDEIYVEGLVHVTTLSSDYYHFEPGRHLLQGERTGRTFRLGDAIRVKVMRVDLDERKIDFEPAQTEPKPPKPPKPKPKPKSASAAEPKAKHPAKRKSRPRRRRRKPAE